MSGSAAPLGEAAAGAEGGGTPADTEGVQRADRLQEPRLLFGDLFNDSMRYFWRVFLLNLLIGIVLFLAFGIFLALGVLGSIATLGIGALCFIPLICLLVPLGWFIGIVIEQANVAIVAENLGVMDGLRRGWEVVRANLGSMLIMGLVLTIGGLIAGLVIGLPLALAIGPAVASAVMSGGDPGTGGWVTTALCLVAYLPILLVLNGILRGYISSAWTLTFLQLARPTIQEPVPTPAL